MNVYLRHIAIHIAFRYLQKHVTLESLTIDSYKNYQDYKKNNFKSDLIEIMSVLLNLL